MDVLELAAFLVVGLLEAIELFQEGGEREALPDLAFDLFDFLFDGLGAEVLMDLEVPGFGLLEALLDLVLDRVLEGFHVGPHSLAPEMDEALLPELLVGVFELLIAVEAVPVLEELLLDAAFVLVEGLLDGSLALVLTHVGPGGLYARDAALVDGLGVGVAELQEHLPIDLLPIEDLRLHLLEDPLPQAVHLLHKLRPELALLDELQVLQVLLLLNGPHHREAVPILEEIHDQPPDPVLLLDGVRRTPLLLQRLLQVVLRVYLVPLLVQQLQSEITHDPHEGWEVLGHLLWVRLLVLRTSYLQLLR
mmetsp:Transcript_29085/g.28077  ORF Transcript_29085/g.28077 Transcript_29085/m.28077 type:complete len:306 (-) Transcript_29085:567-1484(-)